MAQTIVSAQWGPKQADASQPVRLFLCDRRLGAGRSTELLTSSVCQDPLQVFALAQDDRLGGEGAEAVLALLDRHRLAAALAQNSLDLAWLQAFVSDCQRVLAPLVQPHFGRSQGVSLALLVLQGGRAQLVTTGQATLFLYRDRQMKQLPADRDQTASQGLGLAQDQALAGLAAWTVLGTQPGDVFVLASADLGPFLTRQLPLLQPDVFTRQMENLYQALTGQPQAAAGFGLLCARVAAWTASKDQALVFQKRLRRQQRSYLALQRPFSRRTDRLVQDLAAPAWLAPLLALVLTLVFLAALFSRLLARFLP